MNIHMHIKHVAKEHSVHMHTEIHAPVYFLRTLCNTTILCVFISSFVQVFVVPLAIPEIIRPRTCEVVPRPERVRGEAIVNHHRGPPALDPPEHPLPPAPLRVGARVARGRAL